MVAKNIHQELRDHNTLGDIIFFFEKITKTSLQISHLL